MAEQRRSLVEEIKSGDFSISEICRNHGVSRPTAYKWLERDASGESMECRSKAPLSIPNKTAASVEALILQARKRHPGWGGRKLKAYLERAGEKGIPAASTITALLHRNGMISKAASLAAEHWKRFEMGSPNDLWQADFKGHFPMADGKRCHPLTVIDDMSRFSLCISAKGDERLAGVWDSFASLFRKHGLPKSILCDNGNPWGTNFANAYTRFEILLMNYGILPIHGKPLHPQTQGKEERFNRTLKAELLDIKPIEDLPHAQREFDLFRKTYNEDRPHCSLGYGVPADRYRDSVRAMPEKIKEWEYPEGFDVQKIKGNGYIRIKGRKIFLSEAFIGLSVALAESQDDGFLDVIYRNFRIATIDIRDGVSIVKKITRLKQEV